MTRRQPDPPSVPVATSENAAATVTTTRGHLQRLVLTGLAVAHDGLTAEELEPVVHLKGDSIRPRLWEMEHVEWVDRKGDRRRTRSGHTAMVWRITDRGRDVLAGRRDRRYDG